MSEKPKIFRAVFVPGQQQVFLKRLGLDSEVRYRLAGELGYSERALRDWIRGKYRIPWHVLEKICQRFGIDLPAEAQRVSNADLRRPASIRGGLVHLQKYGNPGTPDGRRKGGLISQMRRRENPEKYRQHQCSLRKVINRPSLSADLAEFVGIILGDGSMFGHQVSVSLGSETDREYGFFVARLAQQLFNVEPAISKDKHSRSIRIVISAISLVELLLELGLKRGNKVAQQVDVPTWVSENPEYARACLRGLMDTDGCVFHHRYQVNGKWYEYVKIGFTNHSRPLLAAVEKMLRMFNLHPRHDGVKHIWLDRHSDVHAYFELVRTNNPKHLRRYQMNST